MSGGLHQSHDVALGVVHLVERARFEILPMEGVQDELRRHLSPGTTVHVVCPATLGVDVSVPFACELARRGFDAVPHVAARTVRDSEHLRTLCKQMSDAGIVRAFFPGGDGKVPAGTYTSAVELLRDLGELDHGLTDIGVTCYPQSHPTIPTSVLLSALLEKQAVATFMVSESCLDPSRTIAWLRDVRAKGVRLPLMIGVPGIVPITRLLAAFRTFGLGEARSFLAKQHGMVSAVLRRRFSPADVVTGMAAVATEPELGLDRLHFFTFNEIAKTESWRKQTLQQARAATND